ncbi:MAG: hypothetical protein ABR985_18075 [Methanotrichaceae archaeon]|jgi:hypothetical protein
MVDLCEAIADVPKLVRDYIELIGPKAAGGIITEYVISEIIKLKAEQVQIREDDPNESFQWVHNIVLEILEPGPKSRTKVINELINIKKSKRIRLGEIASYQFYAQTMDTMRFTGELGVSGVNTGTRWSIA